MDSVKKSFFLLHLAIFLFGFTGILGKMILLPALVLVWWRSLLTWVLMLPKMYRVKGFQKMDSKTFKRFMWIGLLVGLHWICFYGSIKLANSSVAMICLAFIPLSTAFFEALFQKKKIKSLDIGTGLIILPGMWLILQNIDFSYRLGFGVGILAAVFSAAFATLNKKYIKTSDEILISWIELFSVWCLMSILMPVVYLFDPNFKFFPSGSDWFYLLFLSYFCTVVAYVFVIRSLQNLSAFTAMLAFNMEPVYGIILAIAVLNEHRQLNLPFYIGVFIILTSVLLHPYLEKKFDRFKTN